MELTIDVLQDDIDKGFKGDSSFCPIALAIKRTVPDLLKVEVDNNISLWIKDDFYYTEEDLGVEAFIHAFDNGREVKPTQFKFNFIKCDDTTI